MSDEARIPTPVDDPMGNQEFDYREWVDQTPGNGILSFKPDREGNLDQQLGQEATEVGAIAENFRKKEELKDKIQRIKNSLEEKNITFSSIEESRNQIIHNALETVCDKLEVQSCAIFLISKQGLLERIGIHGYDQQGQPITDTSLPQEAYAVGESFTGQAAVVPNGEKYGSIQYTHQLDLYPEFRDPYVKVFGELKGAIAIPLNGRNKTYGVLRVINKIQKIPDGKIILSNQSFSDDDFKELLFLATNIANTLSGFRRDKQAEILTSLAQLVVQPIDRLPNTQELYQYILDLLVKNPDTAFNAGIIRIKPPHSNTLEVAGLSYASEAITQDRDNSSRTLEDDGFLWIVAENHKRLVLQDIQRPERLNLFKNQDWIKKNKFQSYACFPLIADNILLGTLSLYAGYRYDVHPDSIRFLQGVANLIARLMLNLKRQNHSYLKLDRTLEEQFNSLVATWKKETSGLSSITKKTMHPAYQEIIELGDDAIPLLLRELNRCPNHWFSALSEITGEDPISPEQWGRVKDMAQVWVEWGKNQGYVFDF